METVAAVLAGLLALSFLPNLSTPAQRPVTTSAVFASSRSALPASSLAGGFAIPAPKDLGFQFSHHACMGYRAIGHTNGMTIFIDPGHGGPDPGAEGSAFTGPAIDEATANLDIALALLPILRHSGYEVVLSRTTDTSVAPAGSALTVHGIHLDQEARVACANASRADLLISIHMNGFGDKSVGGAETIDDVVRPFAAANERFARLLQSDIVSSMRAAGWNVPDRGVLTDDNQGTPTPGAPPGWNHLFLLGPVDRGWNDHPSEMPGALIEPVFISDPSEEAIVATRRGDEVIAGGIVNAVMAYMSETKTSKATR